MIEAEKKICLKGEFLSLKKHSTDVKQGKII